MSIGGTDCPITLITGGTDITCTLPAGVGKDVAVKVTDVSQQISGSGNRLSYRSPDVTMVKGCDDSESLPSNNHWTVFWSASSFDLWYVERLPWFHYRAKGLLVGNKTQLS